MQVGRSATILLVLLVLISTAHAQQVLTSTPTSIQRVPQEGAAPVWSYSLPALSVQMPAISAAALARTVAASLSLGSAESMSST